MIKNDLMDPDVDLDRLAQLTKNYTGAEIEAVCRSANSFALFSEDEIKSAVDQPSDQGKKNKKGKETFNPIKTNMSHFMLALDEVKPAFGVDSN